jgi:light-regulated signal transduction histidine kinase (bacteriophytochrome)
VAGNDELALVARQANQMARSLDRLNGERRRAEAALKESNRDLEAFSYSVAHDLRAPLRGISGFSHALREDLGIKVDDEANDLLRRIEGAADRMQQLIEGLLKMARIGRAELTREAVDLTRAADEVMRQLRTSGPERVVLFANQAEVVAEGDAVLLRAVLDNLLGNSWKFTGAKAEARISFGCREERGQVVYFVKDDGAGFDMTYADKLFAPFQRLHTAAEFAGTGIGLTTVQRIVRRHGGRIWAEGAVGQGSAFYFTLSPDDAKT